MKKPLALLASLFLCLAVLAGCKHQQQVTIVNLTGVDIEQLYMRETGTDEWKYDMLLAAGTDHFPTEESGVFILEQYPRSNVRWDIMFVDSDGDQILFSDLELTPAKILEFTWGFDGETPSIVMTTKDGAKYYDVGTVSRIE